MKTTDIKQNDRNPRTIKDAAFKKLCASIKRDPSFMRLRPIVIDEANVILGGNQRFRAVQQIGMKDIPDDWVVMAKDLTPEQRKRFVVIDNGPSQGEWDWDILAADYDIPDLEELGLDVSKIKTGDPEDADPQIDKADELQEKWATERGQLWAIGDHRLLCGDSAALEDAQKVMGDKLADMIFTDPPYGVAYVGKTKDALKVENDDCSEGELADMCKNWFDAAQAVSRPGAYWLATVPAGPLHKVFFDDWKARDILRQVMVWNKDSMVLGHSEYHYKHEPILFGWVPGGSRRTNPDRTRTTVWDFPRPKASREHPTMKPVEMWCYGIKNHSDVGDIIYEPFLGSGTTMIAAENTRRKCRGLEISPSYCAVILERMITAFPSIDIHKL